MGFSLRRWVLATLSRRDLGVDQVDWKYVRFSYSQFGEDVVVASLLEAPTGFYVDVGAFHPVQISNTYLLYRRGWRGLVIDADPDFVPRFRRRRPRDFPVHAAVAEQSQERRFVITPAGVSSHLQDLARPETKDRSTRIITLQTRTLRSLLDEHLPAGQAIDFLNVDCEHADLEVLRSNDWGRYRPRVIAVEDHQAASASDICRLLTGQHYEPVVTLGVTRIFTANQ